MRIALVCPYDIDRPGGVQTHIRDTAATLQDMGHEVTVIAPRVLNSPERPLVSGSGAVKVYRIGRARKIRFGGTAYEVSIALGRERRALSDIVRKGKFDVVHYHTMWVPFVPLQVFRRATGASVATFHDTTAPSAGGRGLRAIFRCVSRFLIPRLDRVIAVSEGPIESMPRFRAHVRIVQPCTDLRPFLSVDSSRKHMGRVNILFLSRLDERKGAMLLLEAYRRLCAEGLDVALVLAGKGDQEPALRAYAAAHALPHIVFVGEFERESAPALYADCDIFCAPAPYGESFGIVVAEAMASGRPVVAAANLGFRSLLTGGAARFLVPPGDVEALYLALRAIVLDPEARASLGAWGRRSARQYDCQTVVPQLLSIYEEAIHHARREQAA